MNPFSTYIDCINCGNELTHLSKLVFNTPQLIQCDFCGQRYPGLSRKIQRTKTITTIAFIIPALMMGWFTFVRAGIVTSLFALFPLFVIYLFTLAFVVKKAIRF